MAYLPSGFLFVRLDALPARSSLDNGSPLCGGDVERSLRPSPTPVRTAILPTTSRSTCLAVQPAQPSLCQKDLWDRPVEAASFLDLENKEEVLQCSSLDEANNNNNHHADSLPALSLPVTANQKTTDPPLIYCRRRLISYDRQPRLARIQEWWWPTCTRCA